MKIQALLLAVAVLTLAPAPLLASQELSDRFGCSWCHDMNKKTVGPSIRQIAQRYAAQPEALPMLYDKVKNGSNAPWHSAWGMVPMPPNPDINADTVKQIVDWMLEQK
jgi:cytochrome c